MTPTEIASSFAHGVYRPGPMNLSDIAEAIRLAIEFDREQRSA